MHLPLFIARRYLFAKKSHNVINIISAISAVGMAIGTAALIIILSIYNGFDELVKSTLSNVEPDILITPAKGKVFIPEGEAFDRIKANPMIGEYDLILQENVFVDYDGHQGIAKPRAWTALSRRNLLLRNTSPTESFPCTKASCRRWLSARAWLTRWE